MGLPRIAITLGDPAGIGPEVVRAALADPRVRAKCRPIIVGDKRLCAPRAGVYSFVDVPMQGYRSLRPGSVSRAAGEAAYRWVRAACELVVAGGADALVTAPLSKEALHRAGHHYDGHTELLADLTGSRHVAMLMAAGAIRSVMITRHVPLSTVSAQLTSKNIADTVRLSCDFLRRRAGLKKPRVVVCGVNPHAGEGGILGREESRIIAPAVKALVRAGRRVTGPIAADAAWRKTQEGAYDLIVTMYHDQTMIPLKVIAPHSIVNITAGLPFVRTSPGHGTAFDIAGKGRADPRSMIEAILTAARLQCRD